VLSDIKVILFDLGGTLADYPLPRLPVAVGRCVAGVYAMLVRPESERPPAAADLPRPDEARARRASPASDTALAHRAMTALRHIIRSASGRTLPHMAEACARPLMAEGRLFGDTLPTLTALRERGYRLGIVSNTPWGTPEYLWESQLDRFGLTDYFEVRLFSSALGFRKPDGRIFLAALEQMAAPPSRALHVGDRPRTDILGAARAGLRTALLVRPGAHRYRGRAAPDLRIASLDELLDHLPAL